MMVLPGFPLASEAVSGEPDHGPTVPSAVAVTQVVVSVPDPPAQWPICSQSCSFVTILIGWPFE